MKAAKVTVKVAKELVETVPTTATTNVTRSDGFARFAAQSSRYLGSLRTSQSPALLHTIPEWRSRRSKIRGCILRPREPFSRGSALVSV